MAAPASGVAPRWLVHAAPVRLRHPGDWGRPDLVGPLAAAVPVFLRDPATGAAAAAPWGWWAKDMPEYVGAKGRVVDCRDPAAPVVAFPAGRQSQHALTTYQLKICHPDWLASGQPDPAAAGVAACVCPTGALMAAGCRCGYVATRRAAGLPV